MERKENQENTETHMAAKKITSKKMTPLMTQFWDVKAAHPDKVILFRMGDFFEMFHADAELAAPIVGIALTSRNKKSQDETPMCGVPHHAVGPAINKLLKAGLKVAICDQLEDPKFAKGLVKRGVTRTLSPGMVYDSDTLEGYQTNYLASWDEAGSLAFLDISTGEAFYFLNVPIRRRFELLESLGAVEWILPSPSEEDAKEARRYSRSLTQYPKKNLISADGEVLSFESLKFDFMSLPDSAKRVLSYAVSSLSNGEGPLRGAAKTWLESLSEFRQRGLEGRMVLSSATLRHLEIFSTYKGELQGSLFHALNRTKTSSGARLLRSWLQLPLVEENEIERRLSKVELWVKNDSENQILRQKLSRVGDLSRKIAKLSQPSRGPRDVLSLADALDWALEARQVAASTSHYQTGAGFEIGSTDELIQKTVSEIRRVIADEPPLYVRQGGAIKKGARSDLDELIELSQNASRLVLELESRERELTGISSLKVRYNNVFGYSIEVTNTHKDKVPTDRYDRKQTLANAERYTTKELSELEAKVLSAEERRLKLEEDEFQRLIEEILINSQVLSVFAMEIAELDVISSLGYLAFDQKYVRPVFCSSAPTQERRGKTREQEEAYIALKGSRHPVVEQVLKTTFIENDLEMKSGQCLLLTGPNMAGKSTFMRQIALTVIMAQIGSFVPARLAQLSLFDRVSTRIGASDFLSEGLSTFMVEMKETAEILESASDRTLLILDEIGRGTATFDGLSLARAILEYLLSEKSALTLFATHYHELTNLQRKFGSIVSAHMAIAEKNGNITFLYQLTSGASGKSYGIHVAKLAGLPQKVTDRAQEILSEIEGSLESQFVEEGVWQMGTSLQGASMALCQPSPRSAQPSRQSESRQMALSID